MFHSMIIQEKTLIEGFYGHPETWGSILQTIQGGSKSFASMDTFSHCIAMVCSDGVVRIYDVVTGSLRLSLKPDDPIEVVRGSPDGSTLFCASHQSPITSWDIQTGGLIHTFTSIPERVSNMTVSLKGHYLACGFSTGLVEVWKGTNRVKGITTRISSPITLCWLDPEEQLVTAVKTKVQIWDVVVGTVLRSFSMMRNTTKQIVYSREFNHLAIISLDPASITIIDPQTGHSSGGDRSSGTPLCVAFSQTLDELVCCMEAGGLEVFDLTMWNWRYFEYPFVAKFVSCLENGTVAVGSMESGIQLLSLVHDNYTPLPQSTSVPDVYAFDQGRIIAIPAIDHKSIQLLETSTMTELLTVSIRDVHSESPITILAASLENHVACFHHMKYLMLYKFDGYHWKRGGEIYKRPLGGAFSPAGTRLVTLHECEVRELSIRVWNAGSSRLQCQAELKLVDRLNPPPPYITFDSETRFYSHHNKYRIPYDLHPPSRTTTGHKVIRCEQQPWTVESNEREFKVDSSGEWVVSGSERVCWIPPGYFRSNGTGYHWAGPNSLVMIGEEGLKALIFRSQERLFEE